MSDALAWTLLAAGGLDNVQTPTRRGQYFRRTNLAQKAHMGKTKKPEPMRSGRREVCDG
jgi:hypothetical protein